MREARVQLITRAPLRATRKQVRELQAALPELARLDIDLLELALDMIPVCVLAWRPREQAEVIVRELAGEGLEVHAVDLHALHCMLLDCPLEADALVDACFVPTFHPGGVIRATTSLGQSGVDLRLWMAREPIDALPLAMQIHHGLDLDHFRRVEVMRGAASLDAASSGPLLDALAVIRQRRDPESDDSWQGRDGMDVALRMHDEHSAALTLECWSPEPDEQPRLHAALVALLDACARLPIAPDLTRRVKDLRSYL
jgi:hypothetical protein